MCREVGLGQLDKVTLQVSPARCSVTGENWPTALHPTWDIPGAAAASQGSGSFLRKPERIYFSWAHSETHIHEPVCQGGMSRQAEHGAQGVSVLCSSWGS